MLEKIKKMWGHVKSWFATTWIWNAIKNLFSSNDASKASSKPYEGPVYDPKAVEEALAKRKAQDAETPKEPEGKVIPKPEGQPINLEIIKEAEKGKDGNTKPGKAFSESKGAQEQKHAEKPQEEPVGYIKAINNGKLDLFIHKSYASTLEKNQDPQRKWSTKRLWSTIYVTIGKKAYRISGTYHFPYMSGEHIPLHITLLRTQDGRHVHLNDLLDLNGGTEAKVANISDKPFPEVESPANGEAPSSSTVSESRKSNISLVLEGGELVFSPVLSDLLSMKRKESMKMDSPSSETANPQSQQQAVADTGKSLSN